MIIVNNLWKTFRLNRQQRKGIKNENLINAVGGIDFTCQPGRIFTLLGPNGAGKTTTLRMIATLLKPTKGSISVAGFDVIKQPQEVKRKLGFLTGTTNLYERLTPNELVKYFADLHNMEKGLFEKRKKELFNLFDMNKFVDRRIGKLSTGMRQKVSIVRTIIHDPEIVVFDEPTIGLDVITSKSIIELIQRCKEEGKTVIFSTHIMGEVSLLSDDIAIMHRGKLCYSGTYKDFIKNKTSGSIEDEFIRLLQEEQS